MSITVEISETNGATGYSRYKEMKAWCADFDFIAYLFLGVIAGEIKSDGSFEMFDSFWFNDDKEAVLFALRWK